MATPVMLADGDAVDAAHATKAIQAGDGTLNTKMWGARIRYTGSAWEVHSTTFSAGIVSGGLTWSTDHLNVTIAGFTQAPVVQVTPTLGATRYRPEAVAVSSSQVQIQFKNASDTVQTTQGTDMDCYLTVWGS